MISCSFSPGRMPTIRCGRAGATAVARSAVRVEGILGTKISDPRIISRLESTKLTPWSRVIQNRVMRGSVIGSSEAPSAASLRNKGATEPREPSTLP